MSQMAQYIENYLDLIENSPNEIIRQITRLHEKNHVYSKLSDKLEEMLKILVDDGSNSMKKDEMDKNKDQNIDKEISKQDDKPNDKNNDQDDKTKTNKLKDDKTNEDKTNEDKTTDDKLKNEKEISKSNDKECKQDQQITSEKQLNEDEKITKKEKALNSVKRYLLEIQELADEKLSIVQSILEHLDCKNKQLDLDFRNLSSQNTNSKSNSNSSSQNTNDEDSLSGNQENSNSEMNYQKETVSAIAVQTSQSSNVNNHHSSSSNSKRASSRRNPQTGKQEFSNNDLSSSHNNGSNSNNNNGNSSNHHKRGVKRGVNKNSNREVKRSRSSSTRDLTGSPSNLYDDTPIDPDEPTYCVCEQVSFGEMIGEFIGFIFC